MRSHKARLEAYKSDDEVKFGEDAVLSTMNLEALESGRQLRKDYRKEADERRILNIYIKEVRQNMQSRRSI